MKRIFALVLAVMMLCAVAQAAEWVEGTSPSKPYPDQREVDLTETFGYMMFYPNHGLGAQNSCQKLFIYTPREDVTVGEGKLYLGELEDGLIWSTPMNDTSAVTQRPITEAELNGLLWGGGTCFEILLPKTLELGKNYVVNLELGAMKTTDGKVNNWEVGGTDMWYFTVEGDWGVSNMEYLHYEEGSEDGETVMHPTAGDTISFDLVLGGDAVRAIVYSYGEDATVDFLVQVYDESGVVTGTVLAENPAWGVQFMDADNNVLSREDFFETDVQIADALEEEMSEIAEGLAEEAEEEMAG